MDAPAAAARKPCCVCDEPGGKHCTKCKSRHYCSKKCQLVDWRERGHKVACRQMAADFQDRLLDELMPAKLKIKGDPPIVDDVAPAAGSKAAAAVVTAAAATAKAGPQRWRSTCAICLRDLGGHQTYYSCCCQRLCAECSDKCKEYDKRCPLCRAPPSKSDAETLRRHQKHVDEGSAVAQFMLGQAFHFGHLGLEKSSKRALEFYNLAAAQGHEVAQSQLGACYLRGDGVEVDYQTAAMWNQRAAVQGHRGAQANLGTMFYNGDGVAQSFEEAVRWYRLAAAQGDVGLLFSLGACYAKGHGVPKDDDEALRYFRRAAAQGHANAAVCVAKIEACSGRPT